MNPPGPGAHDQQVSSLGRVDEHPGRVVFPYRRVDWHGACPVNRIADRLGSRLPADALQAGLLGPVMGARAYHYPAIVG